MTTRDCRGASSHRWLVLGAFASLLALTSCAVPESTATSGTGVASGELSMLSATSAVTQAGTASSVSTFVPSSSGLSRTTAASSPPAAIPSASAPCTTRSAESTVPTAPMSALENDSHDNWTFAAPTADQLPKVGATEALAAAKKSQVGFPFDAAHPVHVILARLTICANIACSPVDSPYVFANRLVWVVQIAGVEIDVAGPGSNIYHGPTSAIGTAQIIIDATTGKYVMARDWGTLPKATTTAPR